MRIFLNNFFLLVIILITACNQYSESKIENLGEGEELIEPIYDLPITLSEEFKKENNFEDWSQFKLLESSILVIANSISGYLDNDFSYLVDNLGSLSNYSNEMSNSEFELYQNNPEIKGRIKLLNIQIQKVNVNIKDWNKKKGLEELNKIFIFYNYSLNSMNSILSGKYY